MLLKAQCTGNRRICDMFIGKGCTQNNDGYEAWSRGCPLALGGGAVHNQGTTRHLCPRGGTCNRQNRRRSHNLLYKNLGRGGD
ncbi:hypothetical protein SLA2020_402610 [Shorea laevis]